jgi:TldD protein
MADMKMPQAMLDLRPRLKQIIEAAEDRGPQLTGLLASRGGVQISVDNREEQINERRPSAGAVLSAFDGATIHERSVAGYEPARLEEAAAALLKEDGFKPYNVPEEAARHGDFVTAMEIDPMSLSVQEKLDRCRSLHQKVRGRDPRIVNVQVRYGEVIEHSVFASRTADLAQRIQRVNIFILVVMAAEDGQVRYDWETKSGTGGWELLNYTDEEIDRLIQSTADLLSAGRIEPAEYLMITAPGVSGTICHESFGHGVETDMFLKERAQAARFIDQRVGSELVNIGDDPSQPGSFGSYFFDDEGQMAGPTVIVENGLFRRGITDKYSAAALGIPRSANGRRQDYSRKAYARMSNTYFEAGDTSLEDMLAQVDQGVYLDKWSSGMEDPLGWGIQVSCHYGHEIRNGRITDKVFAPVGISGYVPEVLGSITAVSDKLEMDGGHCGKGHKEVVPVASGGPHLLMKARLG